MARASFAVGGLFPGFPLLSLPSAPCCCLCLPPFCALPRSGAPPCLPPSPFARPLLRPSVPCLPFSLRLLPCSVPASAFVGAPSCAILPPRAPRPGSRCGALCRRVRFSPSPRFAPLSAHPSLPSLPAPAHWPPPSPRRPSAASAPAPSSAPPPAAPGSSGGVAALPAAVGASVPGPLRRLLHPSGPFWPRGPPPPLLPTGSLLPLGVARRLWRPAPLWRSGALVRCAWPFCLPCPPLLCGALPFTCAPPPTVPTGGGLPPASGPASLHAGPGTWSSLAGTLAGAPGPSVAAPLLASAQLAPGAAVSSSVGPCPLSRPRSRPGLDFTPVHVFPWPRPARPSPPLAPSLAATCRLRSSRSPHPLTCASPLFCPPHWPPFPLSLCPAGRALPRT
ncbi:unnamed protein product [Pleuronectes platessa]|uniref:Uncharacterized protein n=1 Tax=Pleuronectes platessa TaxID=8262 RepID=A0A9N7U8F2_PLEPL|nr:unnamed protein product [Pleuronectes platessa]